MMNDSSKFPGAKLLIVGRGSIGKKHEANAQKLGVPVVTVDPDSGQNADFQSVEDALCVCGAATFSHALVASPVQYHLGTLRQLVDHEVPSILVEKPLVLPEQLEAVRDLAANPQRSQIYVGFNWRFNSAVQYLKQEIQTGRLGGIHVAQLWAREWLPRYGGHVVLESGSHILDTARFLLGDLSVVGAHVSHHGLHGSADEAGSFLLESHDRVHVSVHVNFIHSGTYDYTINIQGEKGSMAQTPDRFEPMHLRELEAFFQGNTTMLATLEDGVKNLDLLEAILVPQHGVLAHGQ